MWSLGLNKFQPATLTCLGRYNIVLSSRERRFHSSTQLLNTSKVVPEVDYQEKELKSKLTIPFSRAKIGPFFQEEPVIGNQYVQDNALRSYLKRTVPHKILQEWNIDLENFGNRVATDICQLGRECELNPPQLIHQDAWGKRIDNIITCDAWKKLHDISAEEGLIAIAYERKYGEWSRIYQMVKNYLFAPSSGLYSCPLAMTDGAAKIIERLGFSSLNSVFEHLTSRNSQEFWTSGQWMTERKGGSDVANGTETIAVPQPDGNYRLYGYKWFTSATDSDMSLALARIVDGNGQVNQGSTGLTLFYLKSKDNRGNLNNIEVMRLKNKLGTRQLPTAELLLDGVVSQKISEDGRGVAGISTMLTITRIHNAISSVSGMRRIIALARDYSTKRTVFGKPICQYPLHMQTLARMETEARGSLLLVFEVTRLLGLEDCAIISESDAHLLRLLTPLCKLYTAKQAMSVMSEGLECFGGQGYIEDTGLPCMFRDAQVLPIWEGTTNILSLDVLRCLAKSGGQSLIEFYKNVLTKIQPAQQKRELQASMNQVQTAVSQIIKFARNHTDLLETAARDVSYSLARIYIGALLIEQASSLDSSPQDIIAAIRWCQQDMIPMSQGIEHGWYDKNSQDDYNLVMQGYGA